MNTSQNRRHAPGARRLPRHSPIALAILAVLSTPCAMAAVPPGTLPSGGNVVSGAAAISTPNATSMVVSQTTQGAIINWNSFSIGAQASVTFNQPNITAVTLNNDLSGVLSDIEGALTANGRVFIVNPAGVLFGAGAQVNVGGLVASTLEISNGAFNSGVTSGNFAFAASPVSQRLGASVTNSGHITVSDFGTAALLASRVENSGYISTPQGTIAFGAGTQITLDIGGDGLTQMVINAGASNANGVLVQNDQGAALAADGGQVLLHAVYAPPVGLPNPEPTASVVDEGLIQAHSLQSRNGVVTLSSSSAAGGSDSVSVTGGTIDVSGTAADVSGGSIGLTGTNIGLFEHVNTCILAPCPVNFSVLDASGATGGGLISIDALNVAEIDRTSALDADATVNGNGGIVLAAGSAGGLYALGSFSTRGGAQGGNGGSIETLGNGLMLDGIAVDASAVNGSAGTWTIDPYDVTIVHGAAVGSLPTTPFTPLANSTIQDGDINNVLNTGSNVDITTGGTGIGSPTAGIIGINATALGPPPGGPVVIDRSVGTAPLTFRLDANLGITGTNFTIESTSAGQLNAVFDSNANNANPLFGEINLTSGSILTNGGAISMYGQNNPVSGYASSDAGGIFLSSMVLDTRVGQNNANAGGNVTLRGLGGNGESSSAVIVQGSSIDTSTGTITIMGDGNPASVDGVAGGGVDLDGLPVTAGISLPSRLTTTTGSIDITGLTARTGQSFTMTGLNIGLADIVSGSGTIDLRGFGGTDGVSTTPVFNDGIDLGSAATITSASGLTLLTGSSQGGGAGLNFGAGSVIDSGTGDIALRAHNDGATDAIVLDGLVTSVATIDLRPGSVDTNGNAIEDSTDVIAIGGTTGFGISAAVLGNLNASTTVFGSDVQSGAITVSVPVIYSHNLTLEDGAGGGIAVDGSMNVGANTLALTGAGAISQNAPITAGSLLAQSGSANVTLDDTSNNVSAATLAGSGATGFSFTNAGTVDIGAVSAGGFIAASNTPSVLTGAGVASGGNVQVRALSGKMVLNGNVSGSNIDLVDAGVFDNAGSDTITASGTWRAWNNTWVGETRGGLAGSGSLPNLYGCTFSAACVSGITVPATDNHFIYTQQPVLTVNLNGATRQYGLPNAAITYGVSGLILGDLQANVLNGTPTTTATQASNVGGYPIGGGFSSPAGYIVDVNPGLLTITPATLLYTANPNTRVYGDPNGTLAGALTGFRNGDTQASATTGTLSWVTPATQGSNVGTYAIDGSGLSAQNYVFAQAPGDATALTITPATLLYTANPFTRVYGDPNGTLAGTLTGFRNGDTQASATTGTLSWVTPATQGSNVGTYAIDGSGLSAQNYVFAQAPGDATALMITPAMLLYTANPYARFVGEPNGLLDGTLSGFRNGDTQVTATAGTLTWTTNATTLSPAGNYAIDGYGLVAQNYVFAQAPGNAFALTIMPLFTTYTDESVRDPPDSYVYDSNMGFMDLCVWENPAQGTGEQNGDQLAREWTLVRTRPNLTNCVTTNKRNGCADF